MHTTVRRTARIAAALTTVALMMGAESPGCQRRGEVHSERHPAERQVPPDALEAVIEVTEATGPHDVHVRAHAVGDARGDWTREKIAGGPGYQQTLSYSSGSRIEIVIRVSGAKRDMFACRITDGALVVRDRGAGEAYCALTTSR